MAQSTIKPGAAHAVTVDAPARLHLGFLDPGAALGRRFGGIGLALDGLSTIVEVRPHDGLDVGGEETSRATQITQAFCKCYGLNGAVRLRVTRAIPGHAGLGSGTQLALAIGAALARLFGIPVATREMATALGRGRRSGIGISLFDSGGLVVDGGLGPNSSAPPMLSRMSFPPFWRVVLIMDARAAGLSGAAEREAFDQLEPMPGALAAHLCHLTLMQLLPAVSERDFDAFSVATGEIQGIVGDYFAPVQDGRYTSAAVAAAVDFTVERYALKGVGQSSWGPTAFAFAPDQATADSVVMALRERFASSGLHVEAFGAHDSGAVIDVAGASIDSHRGGG